MYTSVQERLNINIININNIYNLNTMAPSCLKSQNLKNCVHTPVQEQLNLKINFHIFTTMKTKIIYLSIHLSMYLMLKHLKI